MTSRDSLPAPFGRYILEQRIGMGGMAEVFRARINNEGFQKAVCIKRLLPHVVESPPMLAMFHDEAALAARLDHANIVKVFDFGDVDGAFYLAMELVDGVDLQRLTKHARHAGERFTVGQTLQVGIAVCRALAHAHRASSSSGAPLNVVHRDISPQNILISRAGEVKVTDFGIAKAAERSSRTATGVLKGKANYMSPEQAACDDVDHRTDQFATAILLWEMLAQRPLFGDAANTKALLAVMKCEVPSLDGLRDDVPPRLDAALLRALSREREGRFADMSAFERALSEVLFALREDPETLQLDRLVAGVLGRRTSEPPRAAAEKLGAGSTGSVLVKRDVAPAAHLAKPSRFTSPTGIASALRGPKYAPLVAELEREHHVTDDYSDLVQRFPCLVGAPGARPWDPFVLDAWAKGVAPEELEHWRAGMGEPKDRSVALAATFVISSFFRRGPVLLPNVQEVWDTAHKAAYASFFQHFARTEPFHDPWWRR